MADAGHKARQRMLRNAFARASGRTQVGSSSRPARWWPIWIAGALAVALSLLVALWLVHPAGPSGHAAKSITQSLP